MEQNEVDRGLVMRQRAERERDVRERGALDRCLTKYARDIHDEMQPYSVRCRHCGLEDRGTLAWLETAGWFGATFGEYCSGCYKEHFRADLAEAERLNAAASAAFLRMCEGPAGESEARREYELAEERWAEFREWRGDGGEGGRRKEKGGSGK